MESLTTRTDGSDGKGSSWGWLLFGLMISASLLSAHEVEADAGFRSNAALCPGMYYYQIFNGHSEGFSSIPLESGCAQKVEPYPKCERHCKGPGKLEWPATELGSKFMIKWVKNFTETVPRWYRYVARSDDGVRVFFSQNGTQQEVISGWRNQSTREYVSDPVYIDRGPYTVEIWYYNDGGRAEIVVYRSQSR